MVKLKKINQAKLEKLALELYDEDLKEITGSYIYKGYHIQISKYNASNSERVNAHYHRRRKDGLCIACGKKVKRNNPLTGKKYRMCEEHRQKIDHKKQ